MFNIFAQNIDRGWYTLEPPRQGGSNMYPITKRRSCNIQIFFFLVVKMKISTGYIFDIFLIFTQNIGRGDSNVYPQSMFWNKNKKIGNTPAYPIFFLYKSGV